MSNTKGRWIQRIGEERQALPITQDFIFRPYDISQGLYRTQYRQHLLASRPIIEGSKKVRIAKDTTYGIIKGYLREHEIAGPYLGLAAAHIPEIYVALFPHIQDHFVTCQDKRKDYKEIAQWIPDVSKAYLGQRHPKFHVEHTDIVDYMHSTEVQFSVLDMDFMTCTDKGLIADVTRGVRQCAADRSVFAFWHCYGRANKMVTIDKTFTPYLSKRLSKWFKILHKDNLRYLEAQPGKTSGQPMQVDIFVLERRRNERRRRTA